MRCGDRAVAQQRHLVRRTPLRPVAPGADDFVLRTVEGRDPLWRLVLGRSWCAGHCMSGGERTCTPTELTELGNCFPEIDLVFGFSPRESIKTW